MFNNSIIMHCDYVVLLGRQSKTDGCILVYCYCLSVRKTRCLSMAYDICIAYLKDLATCLRVQCPCKNDNDELHQNRMHIYRMP